MDGKEIAAVAVYETLLAIHGAEWIVEQVGDGLWEELVLLGLIEEGEVAEGDSASDSAESQGDDSVGEPMDEE